LWRVAASAIAGMQQLAKQTVASRSRDTIKSRQNPNRSFSFNHAAITMKIGVELFDHCSCKEVSVLTGKVKNASPDFGNARRDDCPCEECGARGSCFAVFRRLTINFTNFPVQCRH
jgi:hypothetical protein